MQRIAGCGFWPKNAVVTLRHAYRLRLLAASFHSWLCRNLCAFFRLCGRRSCCPFVVAIQDLQIMSLGNVCRVAKPSRDNVRRISLAKFCLARASEILKGLRPPLQTGSLDDSEELHAKNLIRSAMTYDAVYGAFWRFRKDILQGFHQFREQRDCSGCLAFVTCRLRDLSNVRLADEPMTFSVGRCAAR
jgi:hypothetical protein